MDRSVFFDRVRARPFGGALSQQQVEGVNAILDAADRYGLAEPHHLANTLAEVHHETGGHMLGIKETVYASHKDKNPSDATVIARLDAAFRNGQLPWVKTPYWRDGWFGRGPVQITHRDNYLKFEKRLGVPLTVNPSLALDPKIGADIAVVGMAEGLFTGRKLADYSFPAALDAPAKSNPRRIINGVDGTDAKVASAHRAFVAALVAAGWTGSSAPPPSPASSNPAPTEPPSEAAFSFLRWLRSIFTRS
ncbi:MAG: hypothetical protein DI549_10730 [Ancylobacter novellus]|uniref:Glycoside hydrolase family 19 catalytic domain-containing protein n=1 Tax=Ancylobacter novellus TaxID=921 RepID=A0A2W5QZ43_ANCNO|nr:MAG: hypothetical protein DI549_10730 [Ancylobacter novellus]